MAPSGRASWLSFLRRRPAEILDQGLAAIVHRPRLALKAKALEATAKPVRKLAKQVDIESLAGNRGHFHALSREAKCGGTPAKLALAFAKVLGAPDVVFDLRQGIPIAARLTGAAVHAIDGEKFGPVCHRAAMMPRHAREGRAIFVAFHGLAYGPKCPACNRQIRTGTRVVRNAFARSCLISMCYVNTHADFTSVWWISPPRHGLIPACDRRELFWQAWPLQA
jgi:hypothetical protein